MSNSTQPASTIKNTFGRVSNSTQNDEIKQMERAINEGFAESEKFLKGMKTPFDKSSTQNDHETHTACIERIKKEGASATCCHCNPHDGCTLGERVPEASKTLQEDHEHDYVMDILMIMGVMTTATQYGKIDKILTKLRADARKEVIRRIEAMPDKDVRPEITVWLESKEYCLGYNKALSNVLATLREEEGL